MNILSTRAPHSVVPRWSAGARATQFSERFGKRLQVFGVSFLIASTLGGCGYAGTPPLPSVTLLLEPNSAVVSLGQTQQFQVLVTRAANTAVLWEVNGVTNGYAISGTVTDLGLYTAPLAMPNPAGVTVTVVSVANPHDRASAVVTLQDGIAISVQPPTAPCPMARWRMTIAPVYARNIPTRTILSTSAPFAAGLFRRIHSHERLSPRRRPVRRLAGWSERT
jgi:hypothetical protein